MADDEIKEVTGPKTGRKMPPVKPAKKRPRRRRSEDEIKEVDPGPKTGRGIRS